MYVTIHMYLCIDNINVTGCIIVQRGDYKIIYIRMIGDH